jgi:hypothetical protein
VITGVARSCGVTILRTTGAALATKRWRWNLTLREWRKISYSAGAWFLPEERSVASSADLAVLLEAISRDPRAFIVRGALSQSARDELARNLGRPVRRRKLKKDGVAPTLIEVPRYWIMVDVDNWPLPTWADLADDPDIAIDYAIHELLPESFHDAECWWQLSSSAGFANGVLKAHLFFWLSEPADNSHLKAVLKQQAPAVDRSPFNAAQPHFIAAPIIEGGPDPIPRRTGWRKGSEHTVALPALLASVARSRPAGTGATGLVGGVDDALTRLGDGDGLDGFHVPLRTATLRYARRCLRHNERDDEALKPQLRSAIEAAPRDPRRRAEVREYLEDSYLQRLIDGAFDLHAGDPDIQAIRPHHAAPAHTVEDGRANIAEHVGSFLARTLDWHRRSEAEQAANPVEYAALVVDVGLGKSTAVREALPGFIEAARGEGRTFEDEVLQGALPRRVLWFVPTHKLGNESLAAMQSLGLNVAIMRGREADVPGSSDREDETPAEKMCLNLAAVDDAVLIGHDVESSVCGSGNPGELTCPFRDRCQYQRQKKLVAKADVVIAAHQALFYHLPRQAVGGVGLVIVDESWWQTGLQPNRELRIAGFADEPLLRPVLQKGDFHGTGARLSWRMVPSDEETNALHVLSDKAQAAFSATPDGELVSKASVIAAGLTAAECAIAVKLEWARKVENAIHPGMSPEARKKGMERAAGNISIPRRVGVWAALEELLTGEVEQTGRLQLGTRTDPEGASRIVLLHSRRDIRDSIIKLPQLHLDATMAATIVRHFLPRIKILADIRVQAPHMDIHQIIGGWGKTSFVPSDRAAPDENRRRHNLVGELADFVRLNSGGSALVVTYEAIEDRFGGRGIRTGHFNAIAGLDGFKDVRSVFVIGRPLPDAREMRALVLALTGRPIPAESGQIETRGVLMSDGTGQGMCVRVYADPDLEAMRAAITDAEIVQAIGRARGVNRTAENPLSVVVLADVVLPLAVTRLVRWVDVRPGVIGRMASRGLVLSSAADAARIYPDLFPSAEAAKKALQRAGVHGHLGDIPLGILFLGECPANQLVRVRYRPEGRGQQSRHALVTKDRLATLGVWLTEALGVRVCVQATERDPASDSTRPFVPETGVAMRDPTTDQARLHPSRMIPWCGVQPDFEPPECILRSRHRTLLVVSKMTVGTPNILVVQRAEVSHVERHA